MLDRKIFFLILAILASYVLFTTEGFTKLSKFTGLLSSQEDVDAEARKKEADNPDNWMSGGEPLTEEQGLGTMQAKFKSELNQMIKDEVTNNKGVKI